MDFIQGNGYGIDDCTDGAGIEALVSGELVLSACHFPEKIREVTKHPLNLSIQYHNNYKLHERPILLIQARHLHQYQISGGG